MITLAMLARPPEPGPWPNAIGTMAATSITVVMRMGRKRVWLASLMVWAYHADRSQALNSSVNALHSGKRSSVRSGLAMIQSRGTNEKPQGSPLP